MISRGHLFRCVFFLGWSHRYCLHINYRHSEPTIALSWSVIGNWNTCAASKCQINFHGYVHKVWLTHSNNVHTLCSAECTTRWATFLCAALLPIFLFSFSISFAVSFRFVLPAFLIIYTRAHCVYATWATAARLTHFGAWQLLPSPAAAVRWFLFAAACQTRLELAKKQVLAMATATATAVWAAPAHWPPWWWWCMRRREAKWNATCCKWKTFTCALRHTKVAGGRACWLASGDLFRPPSTITKWRKCWQLHRWW